MSHRIHFSRKIVLEHSWTLFHWKNVKKQNFDFFSKMMIMNNARLLMNIHSLLFWAQAAILLWYWLRLHAMQQRVGAGQEMLGKPCEATRAISPIRSIYGGGPFAIDFWTNFNKFCFLVYFRLLWSFLGLGGIIKVFFKSYQYQYAYLYPYQYLYLYYMCIHTVDGIN